MKILLDENLPVNLKSSIKSNHEVFTVYDMNWSGTKNGKLLELLVSNNFDVFITGDKNLKYQQNLLSYKLSIIILQASSLHIDNLHSLMKKVNIILRKGIKTGLIEIED